MRKVSIPDSGVQRVKALIEIVNSELVKLAEWFFANRLFLNVSKTNFIIFCSSIKKYKSNLINISINGHSITQIKHTKFLGVYIHERLNLEEHVKQLSIKLSTNIGVLLRFKFHLTIQLLHLVYNSLILSYLTYCNLMWSYASPSTINRIVILQKNVRIINKAGYHDHTTLLFKKLVSLRLKISTDSKY